MEYHKKQMGIAVIGAGSWGTALASLLAGKGLNPALWCLEPELIEQIKTRHENSLYLPGIQLEQGIETTADLRQAVAGKEMVLFVVPSHHFREVFAKAKEFIPKDAVLVSATKGIETDTLKTMSQVMAELAPGHADRVVVISGPSFAREVAQKGVTVITAASKDRKAGELVQQTLSADYFRVYTISDLIGAELGGATKNVIAIASGITDGMGLGLNTRAALITRGLAEISRLGIKMGAEPMTFAGLAGIGDLVLTCTGNLSRNYTVGFKIGQGAALKDVLAEMKMVAEGVKNAESVYRLSQRENVEMPITEQVYLLVHAGKSPKLVIQGLMGRKLKNEFWK